MCAIAGFCCPGSGKFGKDEKKWIKILNNMNKVQRHRGPDGSGIFLKPDCGLAHSRLSIIDLESGGQPMSVKIGNSHLTIVYNGEIYNAKKLRVAMQKKGVKFKTKSDTEVVLMGHLLYGVNFVKQLNGIFAYAIWNEKLKNLFLVRDRLGVKPLFFTKIDKTLVFSSEIKGLMEFEGFKAEVDENGLCEIFGLGPARTPGSGVFKKVFEVKPGHVLKFSFEELNEKPYWKLVSRKHVDSFETTVKKTRALVRNAILSQMVSDVPICTFLSGGVDSSIVTAVCSKEFEKLGKKLNTFSFDFAENERFFKSNSFQPSQDRPWVDKMVDCFKTNHAYLECGNNDLINNLFKVVDATDLPCMVDIEASLLHFCSKVAKSNKVALTGECADEIFGGYPWFHRKKMFEAKTFPWSMDLNHRKVLLKKSFLESLPFDEYVKNAYDRTIAETPKLDGENEKEKRRRELSYLNLKWFMQTLLNRMDRTSMFCGLEARVPFADHKIVEYVFNVPWEFKCCGGIVKGLLRKSAEPLLPKEVLYRPKSPYPKIYNPEFERCLKVLILEKMNDCNAPIRNFVDRFKLESFLKTKLSYEKPWFGQLMAGPQMLGFLLQIDYWFDKFKISIV